MAAQEGHPDEAIQNFQQSLHLRPTYAIALLNLGNVYRRQGAFEKALDCLTRAHAIEPDNPEVNYSLGMFYAQQSQMQSASDYLQRAVALRPDYPEALNNLGVLFVREQDYAKAEEQFETCIRLVPTFDQSYLNLARLYVLQNNKGKAIEVLQELLKMQPQNAERDSGNGDVEQNTLMGISKMRSKAGCAFIIAAYESSPPAFSRLISFCILAVR